MIKFYIENNLTNDILYQDDGYVSLDDYHSLIKKENEPNDMKQRLKSVSKNIKNIGLDGLNESYKEILKNDVNINDINNINNTNENDNNENNNNENYYNEYITSDDNELIGGTITSDENNKDIENNGNNQ